MREVQGIRMQRDQQLKCDDVQRRHMKPHSYCLMSTCVSKIVSLVSLLFFFINHSLMVLCPVCTYQALVSKGLCPVAKHDQVLQSRSDKQINAVSAVLPPQLCCCKGRPFPGRRVSSRKTQTSRRQQEGEPDPEQSLAPAWQGGHSLAGHRPPPSFS